MALTLDPSKRNDIIIRQGQSLNFSFLLTNESDGEDFAVAGYTFNLEIYDRRRTKIFDLTDGEGLTVQDGSVAVSISANDLNIPDGDYKYFLVVTNPDEETNTWINGYAKVKDSLSIGSQDDVSVTVSNADNNVNITVGISGSTGNITGEEIKTLYESQPDTNAYTDVEKAKVAVIDTNGSSSEFLARDGQYREIDSGGGTGTFEPVQDITALKEIDTTDAEEYPDKWAILVEDEGAWYRLDRDSAVSEGLPYIVEPNTGPGRWIQDQKAQLDSKVDKVGGDNTFEVTITNPSSWFGSATQMLRSVIQKLHDFIEGQVFKISDIDVSDIDEGQFKIPLVQKVDGEPVVQGSSELIDKLAAQSILLLLSDNANWGNVTGKSGDFIKLEGDNSTGQLGENSQELYDDEGQYFLCISHTLDNPGEATWVRNRNRDALKAGVTQDDAVISELEDETNWNTTTNIKIISVRSKVGSWYKSEPEGYLYHCYKETGTPPNQWYWYRSGLPATESMQVLNTGNYTGLVTALAGHDWSTGAYDPSGLAGEKGTQGQEYYDAINRKLYKCIWDGVKLIWEQIQLVTS